jgi:hypothetical protein
MPEHVERDCRRAQPERRQWLYQQDGRELMAVAAFGRADSAYVGNVLPRSVGPGPELGLSLPARRRQGSSGQRGVTAGTPVGV